MNLVISADIKVEDKLSRCVKRFEILIGNKTH